MEASRTMHVAIISCPGMGHLTPLLELASNLHHRHGLSSTVLVDHSHRDEPLIQSLPPHIHPTILPPAPLDDIPSTAKAETFIILSVARNLPAIRSALSLLSRQFDLVAIVADLFTAGVLSVACEFGAAPYLFFPSNAINLSVFLEVPKLDAKFACEYRDLPDLVRLPGCVPLHGSDLVLPTQDRGDDAYGLFLDQCKKYYDAEGILVNTFENIEPGPCSALQEPVTGRPKIYPVGPLIRSNPTGKVQNDPTGCLKWLGRQPVGSVLYVSFGSVGVLSQEQVTELAMGLEMSGQRFLWVLRTPSDGPADSAFSLIREQRDPRDYLPHGFLERTEGVGLVVPNWAPQVEILHSEATGGFLSHCGWNSTLESVTHGVPMIAWPLYAEQKTNTVAMSEDMKIALEVLGARRGAVVGREEVSRVVKALLEGEEGKEIRRKVKAVQAAARATLEEGGASSRALAEVVRRWKSRASE